MITIIIPDGAPKECAEKLAQKSWFNRSPDLVRQQILTMLRAHDNRFVERLMETLEEKKAVRVLALGEYKLVKLETQTTLCISVQLRTLTSDVPIWIWMHRDKTNESWFEGREP
jgi:hypothetical protein